MKPQFLLILAIALPGCGGNADNPPEQVAEKPLAFDPSDPNRSLRWMSSLTKEEMSIQGNALARQAAIDKRNQAIRELHGKKVEWPLEVGMVSKTARGASIHPARTKIRDMPYRLVVAQDRRIDLTAEDNGLPVEPEPWVLRLRPGDVITVKGTISRITCLVGATPEDGYDFCVDLRDAEVIPRNQKDQR
jgi:hypothetical protein